MAFLGQEEQIRVLQDRFRYLYAALLLGLGLILIKLTYLQILQGDKMRRYSEENRIKRVKISAPRGMIFDRQGTLLIDNQPAFDLEITPQYLREAKNKDEVISKLSKASGISKSIIYRELKKSRRQPAFIPIKIKTDLSRDEVAKIESWKIDMPGVAITTEIKRTSLFGDVSAHLLGYIGEVHSSELNSLNNGKRKYRLGDMMGKFGLEKQMEDVLIGEDGQELLEVDALGRRIRKNEAGSRFLSQDTSKPAIPGNNLVLTIDNDIQLAAVNAFGDKVGSMVAIDPWTGEIIAMLSRPSFDTTSFSRGIPADLWRDLINNEDRPMRDKTIQDHHSPGSVFKVVTAIAGLEEGAIDEETTFNCKGEIKLGNRIYRCWKHHGHGNMKIMKALEESCDVFFYRVSQKLKSVDKIAKWAKALGLGEKTGVPLIGEIPGLIPTEAWKLRALNQPWIGGETLSVAIGQSFVLTTTIQLANMFAAIANRGTLYTPYVVKRIETPEGELVQEFKPQIKSKATISEKTYKIVEEGILNAVNSNKGTAFWQRIPGINFAGKTGTVQVVRLGRDKKYKKCNEMPPNLRDHGVFVGYAPTENPAIAVAVFTEHSCHGSSGSAPIAREVIRTYLAKYFSDKYGPKALAAKRRQIQKEQIEDEGE